MGVARTRPRRRCRLPDAVAQEAGPNAPMTAEVGLARAVRGGQVMLPIRVALSA
jgi:hypothetical protein